MDLISVIICNFDGAKNILRAINSALSQANVNVEVVVVDDGSTDDSVRVIRDSFGMNEKVRLFQKIHGFPSAGGARNIGLAQSKGSFVFFLDSDDEIPENALHTLFAKQQQNDSDIVIGAFRCVGTDGELVKAFYPKFTHCSVSFDEYVSSMNVNDNPLTMVTNKLFRKSLFANENFSENAIYSDVDLIYKIVKKASSITSINSYTYVYYLSNSGMARKPFSRDHLSIIQIFTKFLIFVCENDNNALTRKNAMELTEKYFSISLTRFFHSNISLFFVCCQMIRKSSRLFRKKQIVYPIWFLFPAFFFPFRAISTKIVHFQNRNIFISKIPRTKVGKVDYLSLRRKYFLSRCLKKKYLIKLKSYEKAHNSSVDCTSFIGDSVSFPNGLENIVICEHAFVGEGTSIAEGVRLLADIDSGAEHWGFPVIGSGVTIGRNVTIQGGVIVEDGCNIPEGSFIKKDVLA